METTDQRTNSEAPQSSSVNPQTEAQTIANLEAELKTTREKLKAAEARADKAHVSKQGEAMNEETTRSITGDLGMAQFKYFDFDETFPAIDNANHAGAGVRNIGFTEVAYRSAVAHYQYMPAFRPLSQFTEAITDFHNKQTLSQELLQFQHKVQQSMFRSSDAAYHYGLDYYNSIREAARHKGETAAKAEYDLLSRYFKHDKPSKEGDEPTEAQLERDFRALLHGTKEGERTIKNDSAHTVGGKREIKDDAHKDSPTIHTVIDSGKKA
jgi:hypothetical protein